MFVFKPWIFLICASTNILKQNRKRIDFGIMYCKTCGLYEICSKNIQWQNTFCTSQYIMPFYCSCLFARMSTQYINLLIVYFPCRSSDDINMFSVRLPLYFCLTIQGNRYRIDTGNMKNQNEGLCLKRKVWRY